MALNPRKIAARVLVNVIQDGLSLTAALESAWQSQEKSPASPLSAQDKAFVQALCYGVCRQYDYLNHVLNQLTPKPVKDADIKVLLLLGIYQLKFMRVKPHAAVSETVQAAGKKIWARNLVNAVLRNFQRKQTELDTQTPQSPAAIYNHPDWLIEKLQQDWPEQASSLLFENNQQAPMTLRVNLSKHGRDEYIHLLHAQGINAKTCDFCPSAVTLEHAVNVEQLPGFSQGRVSVQDTAAQMAAFLLDIQPNQRVLDVCAAPGGKTAHILELQPGLQSLLAIDIDPERVQRIHQNLQRTGLSAEIKIGDACHPEQWWDGKLFERILLDAPCSALGVIRRHPDIKLLRRADDIPVLQLLQQGILQAIWPLLAPNGILLYATCSVLKQENQQQIQQFLQQHSDAVEIPIAADWGLACEQGRQILTGESGMDGFYYAKLQKLAR